MKLAYEHLNGFYCSSAKGLVTAAAVAACKSLYNAEKRPDTHISWKDQNILLIFLFLMSLLSLDTIKRAKNAIKNIDLRDHGRLIMLMLVERHDLRVLFIFSTSANENRTCTWDVQLVQMTIYPFRRVLLPVRPCVWIDFKYPIHIHILCFREHTALNE